MSAIIEMKASKTDLFTRKQYMSGECSHKEYYNQFATDEVCSLVAVSIGVDRINNSKEESFNDIPLREWDNIASFVRQAVGRTLAKANGPGGVSLSDCVCTAKAAARIIKER